MPFIGNQPALAYTSFAKQDFTTSATTSYTLDNPVTNENEIALFINFVRQEPTTAYTASGTSLTLTSATSASDDMYCVFLGKAVQTVNPPAGSVGISQLSATGTKDSTTFLRGDNTFATPSSDYILLATTDASSSASVSFDGYFSSTYKNYQIIISSLRPSADATMYMRFRRSNADVTASSYTYITARGYIQNTGNTGVDNDPAGYNQSSFDFGDGLNAGETAGFGANLMIYDPLDTTVYKTFTAQHFWEFTNNAQWNISNWGGQLRDSTSALSGVSFYMASGTISQGNFKLYGLK